MLKNFLTGRSPLLLLGVGLILIFLGLSTWWLLLPKYAPLYKDAPEATQTAMLAALGEAKIPYRVRENTIEVVEAELGRARATLSSVGLPSPVSTGYELFDHADYGMSDFAQKINYQRALEGELSRSIMSMPEIKYARIHLTPKKDALYQLSKEPAKASVVIQTRENIALTNRQIQGIQHLIASAVEGLSIDNVIIVDENGQVISTADEMTDVPSHLQLSSKIEGELQQKLQKLLFNSFGVDEAKISVHVQLNFDRVKSVREQPLLSENGTVIQKQKDTNSTASVEDSKGRSQHSKEVEYVVGKEQSEIEYATGNIEKLSVGIVLPQPVSDIQMKNMQDVLQAAMGIDNQRGDKLVIAYWPTVNTATIPPSSPVATVDNSTKAVVKKESKVSLILYAWIGLIVFIGILIVILILRKIQYRSSVQPVSTSSLSEAQRQQLLIDLKHWLNESKG